MKAIRILIICILLLSSISSSAKIWLPHILGDNMVLQQNAVVNIWGTAYPNSQVMVKPSWNNKTYTVKADASGRWKLALSTPAAGGPYDIRISDGEELTLKNILLGEVWFCSGQSNMEMPLKGFKGQPVRKSNEIIARAKKEQPVRMFTSANEASAEPLDDIVGSWVENTPTNVANCSATAYFFAKYLQETIDVPVGIIVSSWGGTRIESWMSHKALSAPEFEGKIRQMRGFNGASHLYNAKIYPLSQFSIKGFLWYQGESNVDNAILYQTLLTSFVKDIRDAWSQADMPFYYVQIAPFKGSGGTRYAQLRESQLKALTQIPNAGMAITMDVGDENCIHPAEKETVGNRLAYLALAKTYGIGCLGYRAPEYKSLRIEDNKAIVSFNFFSSSGLGASHAIVDGFEMAGNDRLFYPANASVDIHMKEVRVVCDKVDHPVAVRYAYKNFVTSGLFDDAGLPLSSFRTDEW